MCANDANYVYVWNKYKLDELKDITIESKALTIHSLTYNIEAGPNNTPIYLYQKAAYYEGCVYVVSGNNKEVETMLVYDFAYNLVFNINNYILEISNHSFDAPGVDDVKIMMEKVLAESEKQTIELNYIRKK